MRERWPKLRRSSGANQRAERSWSGVLRVTRFAPESDGFLGADLAGAAIALPALPHQVPRRRRQADGQPVQLRGHDQLAAKPRGPGQTEGQIQHVLLIRLGLGQLAVPGRINNHVAGRAGQRALAGALDVDAMLMSNLEDRKSNRRIHFYALSVR